MTYQDDDGFVGIYHHNGKTGKITSDVYMKASLFTLQTTKFFSISDFRIGTNNSIVIEGQNLGSIDFGLIDVNTKGEFRDNSGFGFSEVIWDRSSIRGAFFNIDTAQGNPRLVAGEVKVRYGDILNQSKNSLVGVFMLKWMSRHRTSMFHIKNIVHLSLPIIKGGFLFLSKAKTFFLSILLLSYIKIFYSEVHWYQLLL